MKTSRKHNWKFTNRCPDATENTNTVDLNLKLRACLRRPSRKQASNKKNWCQRMKNKQIHHNTNISSENERGKQSWIQTDAITLKDMIRLSVGENKKCWIGSEQSNNRSITQENQRKQTEIHVWSTFFTARESGPCFHTEEHGEIWSCAQIQTWETAQAIFRWKTMQLLATSWEYETLLHLHPETRELVSLYSASWAILRNKARVWKKSRKKGFHSQQIQNKQNKISGQPQAISVILHGKYFLWGDQAGNPAGAMNWFCWATIFWV